jgi:transcriptional regulator GlxA family with amidase domain
MAYLWSRRVATGVDLLAHTGLPVGEIARRTGFRPVHHLSRRVKEQTGAAPTAWPASSRSSLLVPLESEGVTA